MKRKLLTLASLLLAGLWLGPFATFARAETLPLDPSASHLGIFMQASLQPGRLYRLVISGTGTSERRPGFLDPKVVAPAPDFDPFYCFQPSCHSSPPYAHDMLMVNGAGIHGSLRVGELPYYPPYNGSHVYEFFVYLAPQPTNPNDTCSSGGGGDGRTYFTPNDALYIDGTSSWFYPCASILGADGRPTSERGKLRIDTKATVGEGLASRASGAFEISISDAGPAPTAPGVAPATPRPKPPAAPRPGVQPGSAGSGGALGWTVRGSNVVNGQKLIRVEVEGKGSFSRVVTKVTEVSGTVVVRDIYRRRNGKEYSVRQTWRVEAHKTPAHAFVRSRGEVRLWLPVTLLTSAYSNCRRGMKTYFTLTDHPKGLDSLDIQHQDCGTELSEYGTGYSLVVAIDSG